MTSAAGVMAPAISRSRTAGSKSLRARAQTVEMQARAFARGDDEGGRAGALGLRNFDIAIGAERRGDVVDGVAGFAGLAFEIAAGDRDAQAVRAPAPERGVTGSAARSAQAGSSASKPCMAS